MASTIAAVSGCAVGPNFQAPPAAAPAAYTHEALPIQTQETDVVGGAAQRLLPGGDLPGEWWRLFGSATLEALIDKAMASYPRYCRPAGGAARGPR
jgi:outer membrane protein TolC